MSELLLERPERIGEIVEPERFGIVEKPLSMWERLANNAILRKALILVVLAVVWEAYARKLDNPLLIPTFSSTVAAFYDALVHGGLLDKVWTSIRVLLIGYSIGLLCAAILTTLAITTQIGSDFLELLTAMFTPLPAIALLPLALVWFGLGYMSLSFVLVQSVLWPVALNTHSGFLAVSNTLRMVGKNYGLRGLPYVAKILTPAAFPSILVGMKIGWAFAWRTLIAAELVFGVSSGKGGLGWFIYSAKNTLDIPTVFAGLFTVILIGLFVENVIFHNVENATTNRWGMTAR